jgi:hypothetical protein
MYPNLPLSTPAWVFDAARRRLGDAEVDDLDLAFVRDEDVLRRAVAVDDLEGAAQRVALLVRVVETLEDLGDDEARHRHRDLLLQLARAVLELEQILAPDVLHRDEVSALGAAELEDLADVRMRELPDDLRLVDEHLDELAVLAHRREDPLDRDDLLEPLDAVALGLEHLGHATDGDPIEEEVFTERNCLAHRER